MKDGWNCNKEHSQHSNKLNCCSHPLKCQRCVCIPPLWASDRSSPHILPRCSNLKSVWQPPPQEQGDGAENSVLSRCAPLTKEPSPHTGSRDFHQQRLWPEGRGAGSGDALYDSKLTGAKPKKTASERNWPYPAAVWLWSALSHWTQRRAQDRELRTPSPYAAVTHASPRSWTADRESHVIITVGVYRCLWLIYMVEGCGFIHYLFFLTIWKIPQNPSKMLLECKSKPWPKQKNLSSFKLTSDEGISPPVGHSSALRL